MDKPLFKTPSRRHLPALVAQAAHRSDPRRLVFIGVILMGLVTLWRSVATTDMGFWDISVPLMVMGLGMPLFFVPTTGLALASVEEREMDSAAGLMNFLRTLSGAAATSVVTTVWSNRITGNHAELVGLADGDQRLQSMLEQSGMSADAVLQVLDYQVTSQAVMLATNQLMVAIGIAAWAL